MCVFDLPSLAKLSGQDQPASPKKPESFCKIPAPPPIVGNLLGSPFQEGPPLSPGLRTHSGRSSGLAGCSPETVSPSEAGVSAVTLLVAFSLSPCHSPRTVHTAAAQPTLLLEKKGKDTQRRR